MNIQKINFKAYNHWLILLVLTDIFFVFIVWFIGPSTFKSLIIIILLFTVIIAAIGYQISSRKQKRQREALQLFFYNQDEETLEDLMETTDEFWHPLLHKTSTQLREQSQTIKDKQLELQNYQEFIEGWVHGIKTPLSLATLVLANHKEEMSTYVYKRMEHVRSTINNDVEQILFYARLASDHVDYRFVKLNLADCVQESLEDFLAIAGEKNVDVQLDLKPLQIVSDKKVIIFMLTQLFDNAFKYTASEGGIVEIKSWSEISEEGKIHLSVRDNGKGVPPEDLPFVFDKGFRGSHPDRQNATGMGLFLVKKYAEVLSIDVNIESISTSGQGFGIELIFPIVG